LPSRPQGGKTAPDLPAASRRGVTYFVDRRHMAILSSFGEIIPSFVDNAITDSLKNATHF
jgi:hypothetical protein